MIFSTNPEAQKIAMTFLNIGDIRDGTVKDWFKAMFLSPDFQHVTKNHLVQFKSAEAQDSVDSYEQFPRMKVLTSEMLGCLSVSPYVI